MLYVPSEGRHRGCPGRGIAIEGLQVVGKLGVCREGGRVQAGGSGIAPVADVTQAGKVTQLGSRRPFFAVQNGCQFGFECGQPPQEFKLLLCGRA
jgi:hypothetical protein